MRFDMSFFPSGDMRKDAQLVTHAERMGFDCAWAAETARNPFLPLTIAASATGRIQLGTQIALAFPRSPMVTAQIAWDLARQSGGRFALGLGSQVRAHIERRFSETWTDPIGRMREYVESLNAIWDTFQNDSRLRYRGDHYTFRLMSPFFNPGPNDQAQIPIFLAGVNPRMCELAGEVAAGLHAHVFHTEAYLRQVVKDSVAVGLDKSGRNEVDFQLCVPVFVACDGTAIAKTRERIAFYASTPGYRLIMELHGWHDIADALAKLARAGRWDEMAALIPDETLHEIAIVAPPDEVMPRILERYKGIADRISLEWDGEDSEAISAIASQLPQE